MMMIRTRRAAVFAIASILALSAAEQDPQTAAREALAAFAGGLSNNNPELALSYVNRKSFPDYGAFARNLRGLLEQNEVTSSISPLSNEGDDRKRVLELDWYVEIRSKSGELALVRRRETVRCTVERASPSSKKWLLTNLDPSRLLDLRPLPR